MKWLNFKLICLSFLLCHYAMAEENEAVKTKESTLREKLAPKYTKIQYAGSMGIFSMGGGWLYGKNHWETDILAGYVPTESQRPSLFTLTFKQNYIPWSIDLSKRVSVEPLITGFYINTILNDKELWTSNPDRYPKGYYWHSERFRFNIFVGQRLKFNLNNKHVIKSASAFYEISTCDLYIIKIFTDNYLKPKDYISLSVGLKVGI